MANARGLIIACILLPVLPLEAQDPFFSQYMFNTLWYNPAYAGVEDSSILKISARDQWSGISGNPKTGLISFDKDIEKIKSGAGILILGDQAGLITTAHLDFSYSYKIKITGKTSVRLGASGGIAYMGLDFSKLTFTDTTEKSNYPRGYEDDIKPDIGFGFWLASGNYYMGISGKHLTKPKFHLSNLAYLYDYRFKIFTTGYRFPVNKDLFIVPSLEVLSSGISGLINFSVLTYYHDWFHLGLSYRPTANLFVVMWGGKPIKRIRLSFAYDTSIKDFFGNLLGPSYEGFISYQF